MPKRRDRARRVDPRSNEDLLYFWHRAMFVAAMDTVRHDPNVAELVTEHLRVITQWVNRGAPREDEAANHSLTLLYRTMTDAGVDPPHASLRLIHDRRPPVEGQQGR